MMLLKRIFTTTLLFCAGIVAAQPSFKIVPLGVMGGLDENNLSAYMIAPAGSSNYVCLDAGTIRAGIDKAIKSKSLTGTTDDILKKNIRGYLISHAHLDHVSGLVINSPADSNKNIYGFADCLETIETHYFTPQSWSNFGDRGEAPVLGKYHYQALTSNVEVAVQNTGMTVKAFPLSHSNLTSAAFLLKSNGSYVLYLGDTGADEIEKSDYLYKLWQAIAPLINSKSLKAIMIETSFPNKQPENFLFGHLTPKLLMQEFDNLNHFTNPGALNNLKVIITHLKPPAVNVQKIRQQIKESNKLKLNIIYPKQGQAMVI